MDSTEELQKRVDEIAWYHEFHFPDGVVAKPQPEGLAWHRRTWRFIEAQLDQIDFNGKRVLDLGTWDGYWSFYAERRGAAKVLATDDRFQNWAGNQGIELAKELLGSSIDIRLDVSVYNLDKLDETFDVILFSGIYYHLIDPFYALTQLRHRCHEDTIVVIEGDTSSRLPRHQMFVQHEDHRSSIFIPRADDLTSLLRSAYFDVESQQSMIGRPARNWRAPLARIRDLVRPPRVRLPGGRDRTVTICRPFVGENPNHHYAPPFGLNRYDPRFPIVH